MKKISFLLIAFLIMIGCGKKETATIELEGNPTTGYEWTCDSGDTTILTVEKNYETDNENVVGSGGVYTFVLTGNKEGSTILTCNYKRSWEASEEDEVKTYDVNVDKDLKVTYELK